MLMLFVDCCWRCIFMCAAGSGGVNNFYCPARHSAKTRPHLDFYGVKLFICKRIKAATAAATNCHKMRSIIRFWPFYFVGFCFGFSSELRRPCSTGKISHNDQCPIISRQLLFRFAFSVLWLRFLHFFPTIYNIVWCRATRRECSNCLQKAARVTSSRCSGDSRFEIRDPRAQSPDPKSRTRVRDVRLELPTLLSV